MSWGRVLSLGILTWAVGTLTHDGNSLENRYECGDGLSSFSLPQKHPSGVGEVVWPTLVGKYGARCSWEPVFKIRFLFFDNNVRGRG